MQELGGRRILITGGSRGIGASIAKATAARGAHLALLARDSDDLTSLSKQTMARTIPVDLTDRIAATAAVRKAANELGGLDAVVNNAGAFRLGDIASGEPADWRNMFELNVLALLDVTKAAIPYLKKAPAGQLVNISSLSGRRVSSASHGVYAGTKHAVGAISDGLRQELHGHGIRVTVVTPGVVQTNEGSYITDCEVRAVAERSQRKRGLSPADVAAQIVHVLTAPPDVHLIEIALMSARQLPV